MTDWLGMAARPRTPRPELKATVLARAFAAGRRGVPWMPLAAAAALVLALGMVWAGWQARQLAHERNRLAAELVAVRDTLDLVRSPGARLHFDVMTGGRAGTVTFFADSASGRWLVSCNGLAPNRPGETYQVWFVTAAGMRSALLMPMHDDSPMIAAVGMPDEAVMGVAMSVEPEGGSADPKGPMLFKRML